MSLSKDASHSVNVFSLKLYDKLKKERPRENLFFSPTSICVALAMTYAGAKGNTAEELEHAMDWNTPNTVHEMMKNLQESLMPSSGVSGMELKLANRLWAQSGLPILEEFTKTLQECYRAEMGEADFGSKTEEARQVINRWVEEKTNAKIKELLAQGVLCTDTKLVLVNAVYFKGFWQNEFQASSTVEDWNFKVTKKKTTKVKMMNKTAQFMYATNESLSCQVVKLSYKEQKVAMLLLLPYTVDGLKELEMKMNVYCLQECVNTLTLMKVRVTLPKFKMDCEFKLKDILEGLGIKNIFSSKDADLSGITGTDDLFLSEVVHQAYIDVDEQGTEAAAATAVTCMPTRSIPVFPPHFLADHPFLLVILHCESGAILFTGRVLNPKSE